MPETPRGDSRVKTTRDKTHVSEVPCCRQRERGEREV